MGVGVADNHAPEPLQSADTNMTVADPTCDDITDIKNLTPFRQETDERENLVVHDNIKDTQFLQRCSSEGSYKSPAKCNSQGIRDEELRIEYASDLAQCHAYRQEAHDSIASLHRVLTCDPHGMEDSAFFKVSEDDTARAAETQDALGFMMPPMSRLSGGGGGGGDEFNRGGKRNIPSLEEIHAAQGVVQADLTAMALKEDSLNKELGTARTDRSHIMPDCARDSSRSEDSIQQSILAKGIGCTEARPETHQTSRGECSSHEAIPKSETIFEGGDRVAYWSETHKQWMVALVKRVHFEQSTGQVRSYDLDVKSGAHPKKIQSLPSEPAVINDDKPVAAEAAASVEPGLQSAEPEAASAVPPCEANPCPCELVANQENAEAVGFVVGEHVEYWSESYQQWMPAVVEEVSSDGTAYELDIKKGALKERIRKLSTGTVVATGTVVEKGESMSGPPEPPVSIPAMHIGLGCPGPARQSARRSSFTDGNVLQSTGGEDRSLSLVPPPCRASNLQLADPIAVALTGGSQLADPVPAALSVGVSSYLRSKSPISGRLRTSCSAIPVSQYAHRPVSNISMAELPPQRDPSPISGRRRVFSLDQPSVDVGSSELWSATGPTRRGVSQNGVVICGRQTTNTYASPVLRSRCVMGDATGVASRSSPSRAPTRAADAEKVVGRQSSHAGGAEKSANQLSNASSNVFVNCVRPGERTTVMRTSGKLYPSAGAASTAYLVTPTPGVTAAMRVRSRSVGRNSLVPERIAQDGGATPPVCTMQAQGSARQFSSIPLTTGSGSIPLGSGVAPPGTTSYSGVPSQLSLEDLEVGDGSFNPSQPAVRSQLIAKLNLQGDVRCEEMTGFRGGLNEGVWFLNANGVSLVLKLVKGRRQHNTMPTEAESFVKLSQEHPRIAGDLSITFPIKIFKCMRPDATKLHDLIVMRKAPGKRLAEITACMYHGKDVDSIMPIFERVGKVLREFHARYGNSQHGDFQPSNVLCCEETGAITMIDVGGMGRSHPGTDSDCQHFRKSMDILSRSYPGLVAPCLRHFQCGYDHALSHR